MEQFLLNAVNELMLLSQDAAARTVIGLEAEDITAFYCWIHRVAAHPVFGDRRRPPSRSTCR